LVHLKDGDLRVNAIPTTLGGLPPECCGEARPQRRHDHLGGIVLFVLVILLAPIAASATTPWWNSDWQFRKAITIKLPSTAGSGASSTVVLPVRLHSGNFEYFTDLQPGGADLRFVADDGTPLKHRIELLDAMVGLAVAWVQVPINTGTSQQTIWMYYGNPHSTTQTEASIYDADQVLVLHFGESQGLLRDGTANHNDTSASAIQLGVPGVIGNGGRFDGRSVVRIAARPGLALSSNGGFTFAGWVKLNPASTAGVLYSQQQADAHLEIGVANSKLYADINQGKRTTRVESTQMVPAGQWHHVAVSIGSDITLYVDGSPSGAAASPGLPTIGAEVLIGGRDNEHDPGSLTGDLDEIQVSRTARSSWWVQTSALAQGPQTTLMTYGTDETRGNSGKFAAYLAMMRNLLSQVSLDGLVVITITALIGLASFEVLVSKAGLLRHAERQDAQFLRDFPEFFRRDTVAGAARKFAQAPADPRYSSSGVYEMYRSGIRSLDTLASLSSAAGVSMQLGSEAFEAVRAALDSALVEATNRLNSRLVMMTVAISGAPFLGLLGTVVGVMITFASIAAAGDVNVNTIAPGIAAAMTATVVGLLVAIPSLFGYNWLATRVARRTSAMEVFADHFLSSLGLLAMTLRAQPNEPGKGSGRETADAA
jgi:biopolymer transport protein ExbB